MGEFTKDQYDSPQELAAKVGWEGGLTEAIFGYGICAAELPMGTPETVRDAWRRLDDAEMDLNIIQKWLDQYEL